MTITPGRPAYLQVAADLRGQIANGTLPVGGRLPSMSQIRATYDVSNTVVRDALNELRREGLVIGQQGKGVYVVEAVDPDEPAGIEGRVQALTRSLRELDVRVARLEADASESTRT